MKRIRQKRIKANMTQEVLAKLVGVTVRTINNWENEKTKPHSVFIKKLKEIF